MEGDLTRCFVALNLPGFVISEIRRVQKMLREKVIFTGKFTEPENLHLTLKFLGEIDDGKIEEVKERLKKVRISDLNLENSSPPPNPNLDCYAELGKVGVFSKRIPKIIWIKLNGRIVFELQKVIDSVLEGLFEVENRFMSHITIARVKYVKDTENHRFSVPETLKNKEKVSVKKGFNEYLENIKPKQIRFKVVEFFLKKSELFHEGPVYEDILRVKLE